MRGKVRIDLTGRVQVADGARVLDEAQLPGRQGRLLLACLALRRAPVHRDVLAEALWPHGPPTTWERTLSGVVSRLRSAIADAGFDELPIANAFGCYELQRPATAVLDVELAARDVEAAERALGAGDADAAAASALAAAHIARRPFLAGEDAPWIASTRAELRSVLVRALETIAEARRGTADGVAAAREAIDVEPFRERAHVLLVRAHAAMGQVAEALRAYERCRLLLSEEIGVDPAPATQALYLELLAADEDASRRATAARHSRERQDRAAGWIDRVLAAERTEFVGRRAEIAEVRALQDDARLVTLTGAGGIGKTRLAVRVAAERLDAFPGGVFWCDLSSVRDAAAIPETIAEAVGAVDPLAAIGSEAAEGGTSNIELCLHAALADDAVLVVIDNCEHVVESCAGVVHRLLTACPNVRVVATSREALGLAGERTYVVPPMGLPLGHGVEWTSLVSSDPGRLFVKRARAVRSTFAITPSDAEALSRICVLLDGIPLALELAAARVSVLSLAEIAERLDDALGLLVSRDRSAPDRHRTMQAAIEWSHELLDTAEAVLFRRLAVFAGGFTIEGAERVCGTDPLERRDVLALLSGLVDKSLVVVQDVAGATRCSLLEPLRQFAHAKLVDAGEDEDVRRSHRAYVLDLTAGVSWGLNVDRKRLPAVISELENVDAAQRWSIDRDDAAAAMQLAINTYGVWRYVGRPMDARNGLASALALTDERPSVLRAACLGFLGESLLHGGDVRGAAAAYAKALETFRAREFGPGLGWTLLAIGDTSCSLGDLEAMDDACEEATETFRRLGDDHGLGWALANTAGLSFTAGRLDRSRAHAEACVDMREAAPAETRTRMQGLLGLLDAIAGDITAGRRRYEVALRTLESGSALERHWLSMMVGAYEVGHPELRGLARRRLSVALEAARRGGVVRPVPWILDPAARTAMDDGRAREAAQLFGAAEAMRNKFGDRTCFEPFRTGVDGALTGARDALGDRFEVEYENGAALTVPAVVELCLSVLETVDAT